MTPKAIASLALLLLAGIPRSTLGQCSEIPGFVGFNGLTLTPVSPRVGDEVELRFDVSFQVYSVTSVRLLGATPLLEGNTLGDRTALFRLTAAGAGMASVQLEVTYGTEEQCDDGTGHMFFQLGPDRTTTSPVYAVTISEPAAEGTPTGTTTPTPAPSYTPSPTHTGTPTGTPTCRFTAPEISCELRIVPAAPVVGDTVRVTVVRHSTGLGYPDFWLLPASSLFTGPTGPLDPSSRFDAVFELHASQPGTTTLFAGTTDEFTSCADPQPWPPPGYYWFSASCSAMIEVRATDTPTPTVTPDVQSCVGNCNGGSGVTVTELITMVTIALRMAPISACSAGDANGDGEIAVNEIVTAVNNALNGCAGFLAEKTRLYSLISDGKGSGKLA